jgi:putative Holliday junction resolvase
MRSGRRLGVDVGQVRVGVAQSDPAGVLATPVETIVRAGSDDAALAGRIATLADDAGAMEIVVGLPSHLSGRSGTAAAKARAFATVLAGRWPGSVRLFDERLTTVEARTHLRGAGRSERAGRPIIDQVAAVLLLQAALDAERASGRPPGQCLALDSAPAKGASSSGSDQLRSEPARQAEPGAADPAGALEAHSPGSAGGVAGPAKGTAGGYAE